MKYGSQSVPRFHNHPNGGGCVAEGANVSDRAYVGSNAGICWRDVSVRSGASVGGGSGQIILRGHTTVEAGSQISDNVFLSGATVSGGIVRGNAQLIGKVRVESGAIVEEDAKIDGSSKGLSREYGIRLSGAARVSGKAKVSGNVNIHGNAHIFGKAQVDGGLDPMGGEARTLNISNGTRIFGDAVVTNNPSAEELNRQRGIIQNLIDQTKNNHTEPYPEYIQERLVALELQKRRTEIQPGHPAVLRRNGSLGGPTSHRSFEINISENYTGDEDNYDESGDRRQVSELNGNWMSQEHPAGPWIEEQQISNDCADQNLLRHFFGENVEAFSTSECALAKEKFNQRLMDWMGSRDAGPTLIQAKRVYDEKMQKMVDAAGDTDGEYNGERYASSPDLYIKAFKEAGNEFPRPTKPFLCHDLDGFQDQVSDHLDRIRRVKNEFLGAQGQFCIPAEQSENAGALSNSAISFCQNFYKGGNCGENVEGNRENYFNCQLCKTHRCDSSERKARDKRLGINRSPMPDNMNMERFLGRISNHNRMRNMAVDVEEEVHAEIASQENWLKVGDALKDISSLASNVATCAATIQSLDVGQLYQGGIRVAGEGVARTTSRAAGATSGGFACFNAVSLLVTRLNEVYDMPEFFDYFDEAAQEVSGNEVLSRSRSAVSVMEKVRSLKDAKEDYESMKTAVNASKMAGFNSWDRFKEAINKKTTSGAHFNNMLGQIRTIATTLGPVAYDIQRQKLVDSIKSFKGARDNFDQANRQLQELIISNFEKKEKLDEASKDLMTLRDSVLNRCRGFQQELAFWDRQLSQCDEFDSIYGSGPGKLPIELKPN